MVTTRTGNHWTDTHDGDITDISFSKRKFRNLKP